MQICFSALTKHFVDLRCGDARGPGLGLVDPEYSCKSSWMLSSPVGKNIWNLLKVETLMALINCMGCAAAGLAFILLHDEHALSKDFLHPQCLLAIPFPLP